MVKAINAKKTTTTHPRTGSEFTINLETRGIVETFVEKGKKLNRLKQKAASVSQNSLYK